MLSLLTPLNVNCHASDGRKSTPLHLAAGYNRTRIVQLLLQLGADVHAKVRPFLSLSLSLPLAAGYNRTRIVQLLLQHGADVHAKVRPSLSLYHLHLGDDIRMVELLK